MSREVVLAAVRAPVWRYVDIVVRRSRAPLHELPAS
jgi:hypothetical protein